MVDETSSGKSEYLILFGLLSDHLANSLMTLVSYPISTVITDGRAYQVVDFTV
jgi:hypothetical protein